MDYSDLVFEDLLKFPEISSQIFWKIASTFEEASNLTKTLNLTVKVEPKLEPEIQNENDCFQGNKINIKEEVQDDTAASTQKCQINN